MNDLKKHWLKIANRIDAMSLRERAMVFIAIAITVVSLMNALLIDPTLTRQKQLSEQIVRTQQTTSILQGQIQTLLKMSTTDPNAALRIKLAGLRAQSELSGKTLEDIQSRLVSPQQMPALLEDILRRNKSVHLIALKTLPVEALDGNTASTTKQPGKTDPAGNSTSSGTHVYKHGVEITLTGSYFDLIHYLTAIEALPWRMFWGKAELNVDDSNNITLTLRLYTLSQEQAWISI